MLIIDAVTATAPRMVLSGVFCSPAMTIEPTTVIAEMALVSDISGVCNSGETRRMTSSPRNVANTNT